MLKNSDSISYDVFMSILKYSDHESLKTMSLLSTETELLIRPRIVKYLNKGNKIKARKLFGDPFSFAPTFKLQLVCSKLPKISIDDPGVWKRIRISPFPSKFIDKDNADDIDDMDYRSDIYPIEKIDFDVCSNEDIKFLSTIDSERSVDFIDMYDNSYKNKDCLVDQRG